MASKKQISAKQVGKNVIVIDGDNKYSKAISTPEERKEILDKVKAYNEKNNAKTLKEIITSLAPRTKEKVEKTKTVKVKPEPKKVPEKVVKKVEEKKKEEPKPVAAPARRSGREW